MVSENVTFRTTERYKKYIKLVSINRGLSIGQFIREQVAIRLDEGIKADSGKMAAIQTAVEFGIPIKQAMNLNTPNEAYKLISPDRQSEFNDRIMVVFEENLKTSQEEIGFLGLQQELQQIYNSPVSKTEWEESEELPPCNNMAIHDLRKKKD